MQAGDEGDDITSECQRVRGVDECVAARGDEGDEITRGRPQGIAPTMDEGAIRASLSMVGAILYIWQIGFQL